jgi:3-phosphoglycerate kinase
MHSFADFVLVGGELSQKDNVLIREMHSKADAVKSILFVADLSESKKEITDYSTENFIQIINRSKTIVWNGPMGKV